MAANRWVFPVLLAAGLPTLPACVTTFVNDPADTIATEKRKPSEFALYPRAPGERVALHPEAKADAVAVEVRPPVEPPDPPGPLPIATPSDPPLVRIVRAYLDGQPDVAIQLIRTLDPATQDLLQQLVPAVVQASQMNLGRAGPLEVMVLSGRLDKAAAGLAAKAPLMIERVYFCEDIKSFGHYWPLANQQVLKPGRITQLYTEVRNVPSEPVVDPNEGEGFVTKLVRSIELRDAAGAVIELTDRHGKRWPKIQDTKQDFSRSPLRDYCVLFQFDTPKKPGTYTVTVELRDPQSGRAVSKPTTFRVQ